MGRKSEVAPEKRVEIVLALLRREEPASVLARRHEISQPTLSRWRDEFLAAGQEGLKSKASSKRQQADRVSQLERDLAERDQVIGELTIANRILKKMGHLN